MDQRTSQSDRGKAHERTVFRDGLSNGNIRSPDVARGRFVPVEVGSINIDSVDASYSSQLDDSPGPCLVSSILGQHESNDSPVVGRIVSPRLPAIEESSLGSKLTLHARSWLVIAEGRRQLDSGAGSRDGAHVDGEEVDSICKEVVRHSCDTTTEGYAGELCGRVGSAPGYGTSGGEQRLDVPMRGPNVRSNWSSGMAVNEVMIVRQSRVECRDSKLRNP
jgi:hypothetical protein